MSRATIIKKPITSLLASAALLTTFGCSPGFQTSGLGTSTALNSVSGTPPDPNSTTPPATLQSVDLNGSINGGRFNKTQVISLDIPNKMLVVTLPMLANPFLAGVSAQIPVTGVTGATIGVQTQPDGSSAIVLHMPLANIIRGVNFPTPTALPNGDPLPGVPTAELPSVAVSLNPAKNITATIYFSKQMVGIYVNTPFDPFISLTVPVRNSSKTKILGYFSTVPAKKPAANGGFFVSALIPDDIARVIDNNI